MVSCRALFVTTDIPRHAYITLSSTPEATLSATSSVKERELGFDKYSGRVVVDVLSLLPGGPILQRILMWPEHLQRRPFQAGDGVLLRNLEADTTLNEAAGTIEEEGSFGCMISSSCHMLYNLVIATFAFFCYGQTTRESRRQRLKEAFDPGTEPWKYIVALEDGRRLEVRWRNLLLTSSFG